MNQVDKIKTQPSTTKGKDFKLYTLLIEELRHLHKVWIDNFRVMLTFNSLVLPASFALFVLIARGQIDPTKHPKAPLLLICLALIGSIVTVISLLIIRRVKNMTRLRQSQVRRLEIIICNSISVVPFMEGFYLYGGPIDPDTLNKIAHAYQQPEPDNLGQYTSFFGYSVIGSAFCIAYFIVLVLAIGEINKLWQ